MGAGLKNVLARFQNGCTKVSMTFCKIIMRGFGIIMDE